MYLIRDESELVIVIDGYWFGFEILWECVDNFSVVVFMENILNIISYVINNFVK